MDADTGVPGQPATLSVSLVGQRPIEQALTRRDEIATRSLEGSISGKFKQSVQIFYEIPTESISLFSRTEILALFEDLMTKRKIHGWVGVTATLVGILGSLVSFGCSLYGVTNLDAHYATIGLVSLAIFAPVAKFAITNSEHFNPYFLEFRKYMQRLRQINGPTYIPEEILRLGEGREKGDCR